MCERRLIRFVSAIALGALLVAVWPSFSEWWVRLLQVWGSDVAGASTRIVIPATASPSIPVVAAVIAALALPGRQRALLASGMAVTTLACEMAVVLSGALAHLSAGEVNILAGIPAGAPFVWLLVGVALARRSSAAVRADQ